MGFLTQLLPQRLEDVVELKKGKPLGTGPLGIWIMAAGHVRVPQVDGVGSLKAISTITFIDSGNWSFFQNMSLNLPPSPWMARMMVCSTCWRCKVAKLYHPTNHLYKAMWNEDLQILPEELLPSTHMLLSNHLVALVQSKFCVAVLYLHLFQVRYL